MCRFASETQFLPVFGCSFPFSPCNLGLFFLLFLGISLTAGVISKNEVEINFNGNFTSFIQVDATSTSGMSGGALLDENGSLIGMITLRLLDDYGTPIYGYVYAIPISIVLDFVASSTI